MKLNRFRKEKGNDLSKYTLDEIREKDQLTTDVIVKFIPYAIIIALPASPILMAAYVLLFPNSTPRYFMTQKAMDKKYDDWFKDQLLARDELIRSISTKYFDFLGISFDDLLRRDWPSDKKDARVFNDKILEFLSHSDASWMAKRFKLQNLPPGELELLTRIFVLDYVPGYRWVNLFMGLLLRLPLWTISRLAKLCGMKDYQKILQNSLYHYTFTLDHGPLSGLKKSVLIWQLKKHIKHMRLQDKVLAQDVSQLDRLSPVNLKHFAQQRGVMIEDPEKIKEYIRRFWLPLSLRPDITSSLMMYSVVARTHSIPASV